MTGNPMAPNSATDEERAREIVRAYYDCDRDWTLPEMLMALIMDVRADEREKCAKEVEALMRPDPSPFATSMMAALNSNLRDAAAAIRAMGDKP